ncbi:MAG: sensor histidine kinase [Eubacteriales bacterium]|nr:sensor histidine kinase [Eubacteriales bacterium]
MKGLLYGQKQIQRGLLLIAVLYSSLFAVFITSTSFTPEKVILSFGIIMVQFFRYLFERYRNSDSLQAYFLSFIEYGLIVKLFYGTQTDIETLVFTIFTIDIILFCKSRYSIFFAYGGYAGYNILWGRLSGDLIPFIIESVNYCVFIVMIWGVKVLLQQRDTIYQLNKKILEQSSVMEDLAKMKERNRIAEEVHNTVGHKLTTAIVSLEGAHLLFDSNPKEAHQKLNVARKQLKDGLSNIREVVRTLDSGDLINREGSLQASIEHLIHDAEIQTGVRIRFDFGLTKKLLSLQEHVLLNAVKEGVTNAIRHASPDRIGVSLVQSGEQVELIIDNNGQGFDAVSEGFGLNAIRENAEAIGGKMKYECKPGGFTLFLYLPIVSEE